MTYFKSIGDSVKAKRLIHPEHHESKEIIRHAQNGGITAGTIAIAAVLGVFVFMHFTGTDQLLPLNTYVLWAIASMTLVFAASIIGMLIGIMASEIMAKFHQWQYQNLAMDDAIIELSIRKAIRKVISPYKRVS